MIVAIAPIYSEEEHIERADSRSVAQRKSSSDMRIGTAGWGIPREAAASFAGEGAQLQRYARELQCVEINSSFYRSHKVETYRRWASLTPESFRFSVKLPKAISHEGRLRNAREPLRRFLSEASGLGNRLAAVLVQLPPSFAFDARPARNFFSLLREEFSGAVVCEPRHKTWFTARADAALARLQVTRAAADPALCAEVARPGGWLGPDGDGAGSMLYFRWHGSPRMYWSRYERSWLGQRLEELRQWPPQAQCWCVFDNTASGAAIQNALELRELLSPGLVNAKVAGG